MQRFPESLGCGSSVVGNSRVVVAVDVQFGLVFFVHFKQRLLWCPRGQLVL